MTYTARVLITKAWFLSGIVSQEFETPDANDLSVGLDLLNSLLALKTVDKNKILYYTNYSFNTVAQQEQYFVPDLVDIATLTFNFSSLRWGTNELLRNKYFGSTRPLLIYSIPYTYHCELVLGGANIYLYFIPDQVYTFTLWGKFSYSNVSSLDTDLSLTLAPPQIEYFRYALAQYMCQERNVQFREQNQKTLDRLESLMIDVAPLDLSLNKISAFNGGPASNWPVINLSHGFLPPGSWGR